jgi:hypothetical protein
MRFVPLSAFEPCESGHRILPLRFMRWSEQELFLTNEAGEFLFIDRTAFLDFAKHRLPRTAPEYRALKARHLLVDGDIATPLEPMGFAVPNLDRLWIDPWDYRHELERATLFLAERGMSVSVYNHQLCTVEPTIRHFCRRSISDWKNDYLPACDDCAVREACAGFFSSSTQRQHSAHINPSVIIQ